MLSLKLKRKNESIEIEDKSKKRIPATPTSGGSGGSSGGGGSSSGSSGGGSGGSSGGSSSGNSGTTQPSVTKTEVKIETCISLDNSSLLMKYSHPIKSAGTYRITNDGENVSLKEVRLLEDNKSVIVEVNDRKLMQGDLKVYQMNMPLVADNQKVVLHKGGKAFYSSWRYIKPIRNLTDLEFAKRSREFSTIEIMAHQHPTEKKQ